MKLYNYPEVLCFYSSLTYFSSLVLILINTLHILKISLSVFTILRTVPAELNTFVSEGVGGER